MPPAMHKCGFMPMFGDLLLDLHKTSYSYRSALYNIRRINNDRKERNRPIIAGTVERKCAGSGVQIAILSARIAELTEHFKQNPKDHHSRRGMLR